MHFFTFLSKQVYTMTFLRKLFRQNYVIQQMLYRSRYMEQLNTGTIQIMCILFIDN